MPFTSVPEAIQSIADWGLANIEAMPEGFINQWNSVQIRMSPVDQIVYTAELFYGWLTQLPDEDSKMLMSDLFSFSMSNGWFELQNGRGQSIIDYVAGETESGPPSLTYLSPYPPAPEPASMPQETDNAVVIEEPLAPATVEELS